MVEGGKKPIEIAYPGQRICITEDLEPFNELPIVKKVETKKPSSRTDCELSWCGLSGPYQTHDANDVAMTLQRGRIGLFRLYDSCVQIWGKRASIWEAVKT